MHTVYVQYAYGVYIYICIYVRYRYIYNIHHITIFFFELSSSNRPGMDFLLKRNSHEKHSEVLSDADKRAKYDKFGSDTQPTRWVVTGSWDLNFVRVYNVYVQEISNGTL